MGPGDRVLARKGMCKQMACTWCRRRACQPARTCGFAAQDNVRKRCYLQATWEWGIPPRSGIKTYRAFSTSRTSSPAALAFIASLEVPHLAALLGLVKCLYCRRGAPCHERTRRLVWCHGSE